jgi:hypothetical protein
MVRAGPNWGEKTGKIGILKVKNAYNKPPTLCLWWPIK